MNDFLLISQNNDFISDIRKALAHESYSLAVSDGSDVSCIESASIVLIYSKDALSLLHGIRTISQIGIIIIDDDNCFGYKYLENGADDFISMPLDFKELFARCRAVLRRSSVPKEHSASEIRYDGLFISKESYDVRIQNSSVLLSSREFEIMYLLASNPNKVLTRDEILNGAYGEEYMGDLRSVDVHIKKIRDKVENPKNPWSIKTVRGVGYKFSL